MSSEINKKLKLILHCLFLLLLLSLINSSTNNGEVKITERKIEKPKGSHSEQASLILEDVVAEMKTCDDKQKNCQTSPLQPVTKQITLAGGCYWGVQKYFDKVIGVISTVVGFMEGKEENPSYKEVKAEKTGHAEVVVITYDPSKTNIIKLLDHFFAIIDPTTLNYQKGDSGPQYRTGVFYNTKEEESKIKSYINCIQPLYNKKIVTEVTLASQFYPAEEYHQGYLYKNPHGECHLTDKDFSQTLIIDSSEYSSPYYKCEK